MTQHETERDGKGWQAAWQRRFPWFARMTSHIPPGQFLRYLAVGTWNTLFGYSLYALFTALLTPKLRFGYMYAAVLSNLLSITVAFLGYKLFVFKTQGNYLVEWLRCVLVYGTGMLPGLVLLPFLVEGLRYGFGLERSGPYLAGALITGVTVIYTFFGHKHFSFRTAGNRACYVSIEDGKPIKKPGDDTAERIGKDTGGEFESVLKKN